MRQVFSREAGQVSILVLALAIAFLVVTSMVGSITEVVVAQQRLSAKVEAIALAGAAELEFNQSQSCVIAQEFSTANYGLTLDCFEKSEFIEVRVAMRNPNRFLSALIPNIYATARAGIVGSDQNNGVD